MSLPWCTGAAAQPRMLHGDLAPTHANTQQLTGGPPRSSQNLPLPNSLPPKLPHATVTSGVSPGPECTPKLPRGSFNPQGQQVQAAQGNGGKGPGEKGGVSKQKSWYPTESRTRGWGTDRQHRRSGGDEPRGGEVYNRHFRRLGRASQAPPARPLPPGPARPVLPAALTPAAPGDALGERRAAIGGARLRGEAAQAPWRGSGRAARGGLAHGRLLAVGGPRSQAAGRAQF